MVLPGFLLVLMTLLPNASGENNWPIIVVCWFVQLCSSSAINVAYAFTQELYPTVYRTMALSMASTSARIGALLSSAIGMLDVVHPTLPLVIYGLILLTAGILSIWIWPETKNRKLCNTLDEMEELATTKNSWIINFCSRTKEKTAA